MINLDRNKAVENAGGQHDLVLMASHRAREIQNGSEPRLESDSAPTVIALLEIEQGLYTKEEYLAKDIPDFVL